MADHLTMTRFVVLFFSYAANLQKPLVQAVF